MCRLLPLLHSLHLLGLLLRHLLRTVAGASALLAGFSRHLRSAVGRAHVRGPVAAEASDVLDPVVRSASVAAVGISGQASHCRYPARAAFGLAEVHSDELDRLRSILRSSWRIIRAAGFGRYYVAVVERSRLRGRGDWRIAMVLRRPQLSI